MIADKHKSNICIKRKEARTFINIQQVAEDMHIYVILKTKGKLCLCH